MSSLAPEQRRNRFRNEGRHGRSATCTARTTAQTGVEMEALAGVAIALLTIYDMCKAIDKEMEISDVRLVKKTKRAI